MCGRRARWAHQTRCADGMCTLGSQPCRPAGGPPVAARFSRSLRGGQEDFTPSGLHWDTLHSPSTSERAGVHQTADTQMYTENVCHLGQRKRPCSCMHTGRGGVSNSQLKSVPYSSSSGKGRWAARQVAAAQPPPELPAELPVDAHGCGSSAGSPSMRHTTAASLRPQ